MSERVHFIGIGGIGMSALAQLLLARGISVSGSDAQESEMTARLRGLGAQVSIGHRAEAVEGAGRVILSDAIHEDNVELARARVLGIPVVRRSQLLGELMAEKRGIAVAGTHGKTTVTAMVGAILAEAGMDPTVVAGGTYGPLGGNARAGRGEWLVAEACEAYESYLDLTPEIAVITNIEPDHLDHHKTVEHLRTSFREFAARVPPQGCVVLCADRPELREIAGRTRLPQEVVTYGFAPEAQVRGTEAKASGGGGDARHPRPTGGTCRLWIEGEEVGELRVGIPGLHNVVNALGALAAARRAGAELEAARRALAKFEGADRRFQVLGGGGDARHPRPTGGQVTVVDDYAHHPTEIRATIAAARAAFPGRRLVAVFQPHLYSRTRDFADEFAGALAEADVVALADIYPAREAPLPGVTLGLISKPLEERWGKKVLWEGPRQEVARQLAPHLRAGDVVLVMGAGDIGEAAHEVVGMLASGRTPVRPQPDNVVDCGGEAAA
jgi:UDP-N-acetylmuramate--alanine ligase